MDTLLQEISRCRICADNLPLGPRPVLSANPAAKLLIVGQAPGTQVHQTGIPWNDRSGDRLREWLMLDKTQFYDSRQIAIVPMGFCYPGRGKSGDLPPRPECAPQWHEKILQQLPNIQLILLIGQYAQNYYLKGSAMMQHRTLTERVRHFESCPAPFFPLPHPSPRNQIWLKKNPWFLSECLPVLRQRAEKVLQR